MKRFPFATVAICAISALASLARFGSPDFGHWILGNLVADAFLVFGGRFWLLFTSPFIHVLVPHLIFNIVTMLIYGSIAERVFGSRTVLFVFVLGMVVASTIQIEYYSVVFGTGLSFGISGGVCAVYGFLLASHRPTRHPAGRKEWFLAVLYPVLLVWLYTVELRDITPTGTASHVAGIGTGFLTGWATQRTSKVPPRAVTALLVLATMAMIAWSPWLPAWRAARGDAAHYEPAATSAGPSTGETISSEPPGRALFFINSGPGTKVVYWIDQDGAEQPLTFSKQVSGFPAFRTVSRNWSIPTAALHSLPYGLSDRWVIRNGQGSLIANLNLAGNPNRAVLIDLSDVMGIDIGHE